MKTKKIIIILLSVIAVLTVFSTALIVELVLSGSKVKPVNQLDLNQQKQLEVDSAQESERLEILRRLNEKKSDSRIDETSTEQQRQSVLKNVEKRK